MKKSDSSNSLQESEDSGSGLKGCAIRTRTYVGQPAKIEIREDKIANQLTTVQKDLMIIEIVDLPHKIRFRKKDAKMSGIQGKDIMKPHAQSDIIDNHPKLIIEDFYRNGLLVSGQTKSTNTPAKSIESGLFHSRGFETRKDGISHSLKGAMGGSSKNFLMESGTNQADSSKATFGKSPSQIYPTMTFSAVASLAKVFPLREGVKVFKTLQGELFSSKSAESLEVKDQATYSLRMLRDYFLHPKEETSQLYCFHWMNLGTMSSGRCVTLNISFHKTGKGSLSSVLEEQVDEKYYMTLKVLNRLSGQYDQSGRISEEVAACVNTPSGGHHLPKIEIANTVNQDGYLETGKRKRVDGKAVLTKQAERRIRRLTPRECERLQGFPDDFTKVPTRYNNAGIETSSHPCEKDKIIKGKIMSDSQRYKMMGNAVSVPVITAIGKRILKFIKQ